MIQALDENHWKIVKSEEIKKIIAACSGLYLEAVSNSQEATPGSVVKLNLEAINRSPVAMQLASVTTLPEQKTTVLNTDLKNNTLQNSALDLQLPQSINYTQPYWLKEKGTVGLYTVEDQKNIGIPDIIREAKVIFNVKINGIEIPFERTIVYKYNDDVKGEMYNFLDIVPEVTTTIQDKVLLFPNTKPKYVGVTVKAGKNDIKGDLKLDLPKDWKVSPQSISFQLDKKGMEQTVYFEVTPPAQMSEIIGKSIATIDGIPFDKEQININYDHITKQQILKTSEVKCIRFDLKTNEEKIAYIMGAGDEVPKSLTQMGYKVTLLKPEEITPERLDTFDVVMTGVRAYNTIDALANKQDILFDFVKGGKTMIVQYNTNRDLITSKIAPYPLTISNDQSN